uniref:Uncharacterized protein n=1 Tax=Lygus hesperus TaxID=30085 RepID=A0A146KSF4_LYGHE
MKKTTLTTKNQQPTLTSFFTRKPSSQPNGASSAQQAAKPPTKSEITEAKKRKRATSPKKSPAKSRKIASPAKIKSPTKTIEEFLSPGKTSPRKLSIVVRKTDAPSSSLDRKADLEKRDVQFESPVKSSEVPNGLRRSPRLAEAACNGRTPEKLTEASLKPKVVKKTKLFSPVNDENDVPKLGQTKKSVVSPSKNGCSKKGDAEMADLDFAGLDEAFFGRH